MGNSQDIRDMAEYKKRRYYNQSPEFQESETGKIESDGYGNRVRG